MIIRHHNSGGFKPYRPLIAGEVSNNLHTMQNAGRTPTDLTVLTDDELVALLSTYAHDDDMVTAVLTEMEDREADVPVAEQLADLVRAERREGESLDQTVDRMYGEFTYARYLAAEEACQGHLLNKAGIEADVDPYSLFHGNARRAAKYASRELLDWWKEHRRIIWIQFKADRLGRPSDIRAAAAARRIAADFGL
jgi:hypothetical protein